MPRPAPQPGGEDAVHDGRRGRDVAHGPDAVRRRALDGAAVLESVRRTSRLLIAHEAVMPFGLGAEIAATVAREAFWDLDAPIERVGAAPTPPPYAPSLERAWLPDRDDIAAAIRRFAAV